MNFAEVPKTSIRSASAHSKSTRTSGWEGEPS
jgi:hypothetical protein